jgi:photosystem II stability/assembly factor-like uncharacterized protein
MILLLMTVACSRVPSPEVTSPSPKLDANRVTPTATVTPISTATILPVPTTIPEAPFKGLRMFSSLDGWAWGWEPDGDDHLWHTIDGGLTWIEVSPQAMDLSHAGRGGFLGANAWVGVCGLPNQDCGLARTSDGGKTWAVVNDSLGNIFDYDIRFFDERDGIMESYGVAAGTGSWLIKETHDGGATWTRIRLASYPMGPILDQVGEMETCNICGDTLYIDPDRLIIVRGNLAQNPAGEIELSITTDRGQAWRTLELPLPPGRFGRSWIRPWRPVFHNSQDGVLPVVLSEESRRRSAIAFYVTNDGGLSWAFRSLIEENMETAYEQVESVSDQDLFLRCGEALCVSHDGARTWQRVQANLDFKNRDAETYVRIFDFADAMTGWALVDSDQGAAALWQTTNGGKAWIMLSPDFLP